MPEWKVNSILFRPRLQSMAFSNEISGVQEQNMECVSVQFYLSVHFKCAHEILNLYEILTKKVIIAVKIYQFKGFSVPYSGRKF